MGFWNFNTFTVTDDVDFTKRAQFNLSGLLTATTVDVATAAGDANVCLASMSIPAAYSCIRTDYIEIASGVTVEIGAGAYLDIT
jgi:hypothetical protein